MVLPSDFEQSIRQLWHGFLQRIEPCRPDLHRYCRALTGSVWDAEDLAQETLLRAFAKLGDITSSVENPKAYLLRVASNLWIDQIRKTRELIAADCELAADPQQAVEVRDAARRLIQLLSPQERAAVVLKEVFDLQLAEIATILETTVGAIKSALHGARHKLTAPQQPARPSARVSEQLVDRFVDRFNARDLNGLTELLRADVIGEVVGMGSWHGPAEVRDNPLYYALFLEHGNPRAQRRVFFEEPIVLVSYALENADDAVVRNVLRLEEARGEIRHLRFFTLCPETLREIAGALGTPAKTNGYGPWSPEFLSMRKQAQYLDWTARRSARVAQ